MVLTYGEKKIVLLIKKNFCKFKVKALQKKMRSQVQFIQTEKGQNNFWNTLLF